jgi:hypothetical protein
MHESACRDPAKGRLYPFYSTWSRWPAGPQALSLPSPHSELGGTDSLPPPPHLSDSVVDDGGLACHLWAVVGVAELGGEVEPEVRVPINLLVSKLEGLRIFCLASVRPVK